ncbi:MAG: hypothetical protein AMJ78_05770 [Omnitrophica WOR_2 bacterium SM23_29]|nr:MAG: hypothetical protein AMJ78_05770 [Omnitrophica WOR_2 bacterium SM23_29]
MGIISGLSLSKSIWSVTFKMLARYPRILLPFFITAFAEGLVLTVFFYFPRPPLSFIFAQPIRAFFGERFLHYPDNFLLLPQLFYYGQVLVTMTVGVVMLGMAMGMVYEANTEGEKVKIFGNFNRALRRYVTLAGLWLVTFIISLIILRAPRFLVIKFLQPTAPVRILLQVLFYGGVVLTFIIEVLFIYAYPAIIIERRKFLGAIKKSFSISKRVFLTTIVLVITPRILDVMAMALKQKFVGLMNLTLPEITLVILAGGIAVTFVTDSLVFLTTANLFVLSKETEKEVTT